MPLPAAHNSGFDDVYRTNFGFVWRTLRHLGVEPARIDDAAQDTFLVVHRRLPEFAGRSSLRTWLFQISRRVASHYRRSAAREAAQRSALAEAATPSFGGVEQAETAELVRMFLDELDHDKAVVFVLAELEQWQAPEIADELALNVNTVYTRLRAARKQLDRLVRRFDARDRRGGPHGGARLLGALIVVDPPSPPPWHAVAAHEPSVLSDMFLRTCTIEPARASVGLVAAGGPTILGVSLAGAAVAAVMLLAARPPAPPSDPAPTIRGEAPRPADPVAASPASPSPEFVEPPAPATAAPRPRAAPGSTLVAELALVEPLRAALLAADDHAALALVERHRRRFPRGLFVEEVAAAVVEVRCRLGERDAARREAATFRERWPASTLAARVAAICGS